MSRVLKCPASWKLCQKVPKKPPSKYALQGTMLHQIMEEVLVGKTRNYEKLKPELKYYIDGAVEFVNIIKSNTSGEYEEAHEVRVKMKSWSKKLVDVWGTSDFMLYDQRKNIYHIMDWKFGQVAVYAHNNVQGLIYCAGAIGYKTMNNIKEINFHIVQPPIENFDTYTFSYKRLQDFVYDELVPAVEAAQSKYPKFVAGEEQCKWCPAQMECPARYKQTLKDAKDIFKVVQVLDVVSEDELSALLFKAKGVEAHIKALRAYALEKALAGKPLPNWKIVNGKSTRSWRDKEAAAKWLSEKSDDCFVTKLLSPSQMEKKNRSFKKDPEFQALIHKPQGKPVLVPESDKRQPLIVDAFKEVLL